MSEDIVTDLRFVAEIHQGRIRHECISEAADEIERLRNRLEKFERAAWELSMNGIFTHSVSGQIALDTYTKAVRGE